MSKRLAILTVLVAGLSVGGSPSAFAGTAPSATNGGETVTGTAVTTGDNLAPSVDVTRRGVGPLSGASRPGSRLRGNVKRSARVRGVAASRVPSCSYLNGVLTSGGVSLRDPGSVSAYLYGGYGCSPSGFLVKTAQCYGTCDPAGGGTGDTATAPGSYIPLPSPNPDPFFARVLDAIPLPDGRFSPPVDEVGDAFAIVGMPIFYSVDPEQWVAVEATALDDSNTWFVSMVATPMGLRFDPGTGDEKSSRCAGPGRIIRTAEDAAAAEAAADGGCFAVYSGRPVAGDADARLFIDWWVVTDTNIPGAARPGFVHTTSSAEAIPVRAFQAVVRNVS